MYDVGLHIRVDSGGLDIRVDRVGLHIRVDSGGLDIRVYDVGLHLSLIHI